MDEIWRPSRRVTPDMAALVRRALRFSTGRQVAERFGLSEATVSRIRWEAQP